MQKRLAKSAPLLKWNELTITIKELETGLEKEKDEKVKEVSPTIQHILAHLAEDPGCSLELSRHFTFADCPHAAGEDCRT
jgi:hypothetical protein